MQHYLSKVPDIEQVEGLEELALPHSERLATGREEGPDVLQTEKLRDRNSYYYVAHAHAACPRSHRERPKKRPGGSPQSEAAAQWPCSRVYPAATRPGPRGHAVTKADEMSVLVKLMFYEDRQEQTRQQKR